MKFKIENGNPDRITHSCQVIGVFENNELSGTAKKLDKISKNYFSQLLKSGEFEGKTGQTLLLHSVPNLPARRILLVGCGKQTVLTARDYRKIILNSMKALNSAKIKDAVVHLTELAVNGHDAAWKVKQLVEVTFEALYQFDEFKSHKEQKSSLQQIHLPLSDKKQIAMSEIAIKQGLAIADGMEFTKNLANRPSNIATPAYLADQAKLLAKKYQSIKVKVLEERDMEKLGMGAFLAVTKGSDENAKLVCLEYQGANKKQAPIALVGKGITFDTGGLSLKPADSMVGMKYDMCGTATVMGTFKAVAELKLPVNLVGVLAIAENMPSGHATKPEDIVTTLSGQTVEIMNTDAEGRLVLCDALTYVERYKPEVVIDIATLTGAVVIALGHHATGMLSNHQPLADELLAAGIESHDRAWQLPLWEDYQEQLKSPFADMSNVGGRAAGTITAACFLSRFAKKFHWAHLDVAGTAAMMMGGDRYATGRPVPLLVQFLLNRVRK
ncbi:MAG TPA: leucyl aminopeptidase [Gammaproteobacteria bacterium]|nr:leucyl aminopeptidase [Gammaproteobacteria bacterium]